MKLAFSIKEVFPPAQITGYGEASGVGVLASDIILILTGVAGIVAIIFIIIGGFKFLTSSGDEKKLASATGTLNYAIIGLAVVILAFVIIKVVQYFLKSEIPIT